MIFCLAFSVHLIRREVHGVPIYREFPGVSGDLADAGACDALLSASEWAVGAPRHFGEGQRYVVGIAATDLAPQRNLRAGGVSGGRLSNLVEGASACLPAALYRTETS